MFFYSSILWLISLADISATIYGISHDLFPEWNPLLLWFFERWGLTGLVVSKMIVHTSLTVVMFVASRHEITRRKMTVERARAYFKSAITAYLLIALPAYIALVY